MFTIQKLRLHKAKNIDINTIKNVFSIYLNNIVHNKPTITNIVDKYEPKNIDQCTHTNDIISTAIDNNLDYVYCGHTFVDLRMHHPV